MDSILLKHKLFKMIKSCA